MTPNLKVYIAAPYPWREYAIEQMVKVEQAGFEVTSTWLRHPDTENDAHARLDLADVTRADVLVAINPPGFENAGTGGRHVELGYALALQKRVVLVGHPSNIFHHLSDVVRVPTCVELVAALQNLTPVPAPAPAPISVGAMANTDYVADPRD